MNRNKKKQIHKKIYYSGCMFFHGSWKHPAGHCCRKSPKGRKCLCILEEDGTVSGVYVVNEYDLEKDTRITDYGDYTEVTNLTTEDKIEETADGYTVEGKKGKFYYQGNLETKKLPWKIQISYYLNGEKINPKELAGEKRKSGNPDFRKEK